MCAKIHFKELEITQELRVGSDLQKLHTLYPELPFKFGCKRGECGVCAFFVCEGRQNLTRITPEEKKTLQRKQLGEGYRLACQCAINGDISILTKGI